MTPRPRQKRPTLADIARQAQVSIPTVSYILNGRARERHLSEQTTRRVLAVAEEIGYIRDTLASSLRRQTTTSIGLLVSDLERGWANRVMKGMMKILAPENYSISLAVHFWDPDLERRELETYLGERKAAIVTRPLKENLPMYQRIQERGVPLILLEDIPSMAQCNSVMWDSAKAVQRSVNHLVRCGRKKIAFYGVERGSEEENIRRKAFLEALRNENIEFNPDWMILDQRYTLEEDTENHGRLLGYGTALRELLDSGKQRPDAILASTDALATLCKFMVENDYKLSVPEDISIMGMGDHGESGIIGLSTTFEPLEDIGIAVGRLALALIDGERKAPIREYIPGDQLVARYTTPSPIIETVGSNI